MIIFVFALFDFEKKEEKKEEGCISNKVGVKVAQQQKKKKKKTKKNLIKSFAFFPLSHSCRNFPLRTA